MNRYVVVTAVLTVPLVVAAVAFALHGTPSASQSAPPATAATSTATGPVLTFPPALEDGRYFGLIRSVDLAGSSGTMVFDVADLLSGEAANEYAAARGWEVPVANDSLIANDDETSRTLPISPRARILLMDWDRCCEPVPADRDQLAAADVTHAWGYWVTLQDGVVVKIEEQYHP
ncbi:MAG TPA: hypothetical protein VGJ34_00680 [Gaiellaceae bacterium]|jgi:hypothetical protein